MFSKMFAAMVFAFLPISYGEVIELDYTNFHSVVDGHTNVLVSFYAPWCSYCKALAPQYHLLSETYGEDDDIILAEVNGPENPALSSEYLVTGFPTILFFPKGSNNPTPYTDDKTLEAMTNWMNNKLGVERYVPLPRSAAVDLDKKNFADFINDNPHGAVVLFYSRGDCPSGNCMGMIYKMEMLTEIYKGDNLKFGRLDGAMGPRIVVHYGAFNYPVLAYFKGESDDEFTGFDAQPEKLETNPSLEQMVKFVNEHSGLQRTVDGTLEPTAGHIKPINELISRVDLIDNQYLEQLEDLMKSLQSNEEIDFNEKYGNWYLSFGQKIAERGWKYAQYELERLEKMILPTSKISPVKKTEIMFRVNILQAYFTFFRHTYATME